VVRRHDELAGRRRFGGSNAACPEPLLDHDLVGGGVEQVALRAVAARKVARLVPMAATEMDTIEDHSDVIVEQHGGDLVHHGVRARARRQAIGATERIRGQHDQRQMRRQGGGNLRLAGAGQARDRDQGRLPPCPRRTCEAGEHL